MSLFQQFQKAPFLSQFLLGILAIFSLPSIQVSHVENERTAISQHLNYDGVKEIIQETKSAFLAERTTLEIAEPQQAVVFAEIFAFSYQFDGNDAHPIRAGPQFS